MSKWKLGLGVLALVLGAMFLMGYITVPDIPVGGDSASVGVGFYNADGDAINVPLAIMAGGREVETMKVVVSWVIQGENLQPNTFNLDVVLQFDLYDWGQEKYLHHDRYDFDSSEMSGSKEKTYNLAVFLTDVMGESYLAKGWKLEIYATLVATATDVSGDAVEDTVVTDAIGVILTWLPVSGTLSIVAYEVKRYIQIP